MTQPHPTGDPGATRRHPDGATAAGAVDRPATAVDTSERTGPITLPGARWQAVQVPAQGGSSGPAPGPHPPAPGQAFGHGPTGYAPPTGYGPTGWADPALGPAPSTTGAPAPAGHPTPGQHGAPPPSPGNAAATTAGGGRRRSTPLLALAVIVVLVAGGVVAYLSLRGGGADTPAEATRLLADDLQSADLTGALTRLHPEEAALGADLGTVFHDELVRLEVVRPDTDPEALLTGATFTDLRFDDTAVEQVRPGVAITKLVGGTITLDRSAGALPLTDSYRQLAYPGGPPTSAPEVVDIAEVAAEQGRPVRVATVQVDGDWYVSLAYTVADNALVAAGEPWPQGTIAPRGAATAQDALRESVTALLAQDARRLVELAPPGELSVVHDLGPLLVEKAGSSGSSGARLVDLATSETAVDGGTALTLDRLVATDGRGNQFTVVRDGDCLSVTASGGGGTNRVCADELARQGVGALPRTTDPALREVLSEVARAALGLRVVVVEQDGQYYVSPVRTLAALGIDVLRTLEPTDLARLAEAGR